MTIEHILALESAPNTPDPLEPRPWLKGRTALSFPVEFKEFRELRGGRRVWMPVDDDQSPSHVLVVPLFWTWNEEFVRLVACYLRRFLPAEDQADAVAAVTLKNTRRVRPTIYVEARGQRVVVPFSSDDRDYFSDAGMIAVLRRFAARSPIPLATLDDPTSRARIITRQVDDNERPDAPATPRRAAGPHDDAVREALAARWDLLASTDTRSLDLELSANCIRWMLRDPSAISPATLETLQQQTARTENAVARWAVQDAEDAEDDDEQDDDVDEDDEEEEEEDGDGDEAERADVEADELIIETAGRALQRLATKNPAAANRIAATIFRHERRLS
jgi:hypothetical protein